MNLTEKVLDFIVSMKHQTGACCLAYAGGVALNILTNTLIAKDLGFDEVRIPPCCNDTGIAIGAAALTVGSGNFVHKHSPFLCNSDIKS